MNDVTQILSQIEDGDGQAAEKLLPLVYDELRKLAASRMAKENPGQTLQATALVHEAYIRLVDVEKAQHWNSRGHFFGAASEAMRRILVENARRKSGPEAGGDRIRCDFSDAVLAAEDAPREFLALNDAIEALAAEDPTAGQLMMLRIFAGLSVDEAAEVMGLAHTTAYRHWTYARAWLQADLEDVH
jgi:RNA polymerase sigma factor (TIGR02999 family)